MAGQGIPDFGFGTHSQVGAGEDNSHVQLHPTDELVEGEATNTGDPARVSLASLKWVPNKQHRWTVNISSSSKHLDVTRPTGRRNPSLLSLSAQQAILQAEPSLVTPPGPTQGARQTPPQQNVKGQFNRPPPQGRLSVHDTRDTYGETGSYYDHPSNVQQRRPLHSRLGPHNINNEWDDTDADDPTWQDDEGSSVFNHLQRNYESYRPRSRAVYNEAAAHDFSLVYRPAEAAEHSKFIRSIALAPLEKAKLPQTVGKFNGLTDPDDHVRVFTSVGVLGQWTMPMWCHLFVQTLTGAARVWFDSLPSGRIKSWVDFRDQFVTHFSQQRRYQRDTSEVTDIWRRENEGLEDFITRFNKECLEIGGVSEDLMRAHFKKAIRCDSLIRTITEKDGMPKEWDKLMAAAKIVAQTE
ncbi:putative retrotransposon gag domain-containing protein [Helianthus anomalus]